MEFYENGGDADGPAALEQPVDAEGGRADRAPLPRRRRRRRRYASTSSRRRRRFRPAIWRTAVSSTAIAATARPTGGDRQHGADPRSRSRELGRSALRHATHLQKPANPDAVWEIAVPNGTYVVRVVSGDATNFDSVFRMTVEGVLTVTGTPTRVAVDRGDGDGHGDRRPTHHPQRRGGEQQQDLFRGDHAAITLEAASTRRVSGRCPVLHRRFRRDVLVSVGSMIDPTPDARPRRRPAAGRSSSCSSTTRRLSAPRSASCSRRSPTSSCTAACWRSTRSRWPTQIAPTHHPAGSRHAGHRRADPGPLVPDQSADRRHAGHRALGQRRRRRRGPGRSPRARTATWSSCRRRRS